MTAGRGDPQVVVIGAGFCGLAAAYQLTRQGVKTIVVESDSVVGGLAGSFVVNGAPLEKFYHHWFMSDEHVMELVEELGTRDHVVFLPTRTAMYYANDVYRLSTPLDVLRFRPLPMSDRFRLGLLALRARRVKEWRKLETLTASEWLRQLAGDRVFDTVWGPLLRAKFGAEAPEVSAVWFWNKLKLRGGSRGKRGSELLGYYRGGFAALAREMARFIESGGGRIVLGHPVDSLLVDAGAVAGVRTAGEELRADAVIATPALPIIADLLQPHVSVDYDLMLRRIRYLGSVCLVLELSRSLSETYWLNVNDPTFPFVGVIEHTNFQPKADYGGRHIVYLSKYVVPSDELFNLNDEDMLSFAIPHLQRMFPEFEKDWILRYHVWRARYSQPVVERNYGALIPQHTTPLRGFYIATMAQIYPEDRGTNYAIRDGRRIGALVAAALPDGSAG